MTKNSFLKGAAILGMAGMVIKILGAIYRIPLSNMITDEGMGYYQPSFQVYALILAISTAGFPTAIAKLVSEKNALGDYKGAHRVFKVSLVAMTVAGIITSSFVYFTAEKLVNMIGNSDSYYSMIALVPALFFVSIMSVFRGYFQGRQTMVPTALSQIIEQLFRVTAGLYLAYTFLDMGLPQAAGGASFGASAGAIAGMITILIMYFRNRKDIRADIKRTSSVPLETVNTVIKNLLKIAVPIAIGASIVPIINTVDAAIVMRRLQSIGYTQKEASALYGQLGGMAQTLINFPQVFSLALAMSLVPAISDAFARKSYDRIKKITRSGARMTLLVGLPATFGLFILAKPITQLLYSGNGVDTINSTASILEILAFSVVFLTLIQSLTAVLQGLGKAIIPVRNLAIGAVVKVVLTYELTAVPSINIRGAAISTVVAYIIATTLNIIEVKKYTKVKFNLMDTFIKPLFATLLMTLSVWTTYKYMASTFGGNMATILSVVVGFIVYVLSLLIIGTITSNDLEILPAGKKITRILKLLGLLRD